MRRQQQGDSEASGRSRARFSEAADDPRHPMDIIALSVATTLPTPRLEDPLGFAHGPRSGKLLYASRLKARNPIEVVHP